MRPGRLISVILVSVIAWTSPRADSSAPPYLLVPPLNQNLQSQNLQSQNPATKTEQLPETGDHLLVAGSSPSFTLEFADVRDNTGHGFDDPLQGSQRRDIAVAVFEQLSQILDNEPGTAKIVLDSRSPWLNDDTLGIGLPFFQCIDGFQKPIIRNALTSDTHVYTHEGELLVNFDLPLNASLDAPPAGKYDLYTVLFHEMVHILGFVGFTVEADGRPQDCGGARMLPAFAEFTRDESGNTLWREEGGQIVFIGQPGSLPTGQVPVSLSLPDAQGQLLHLTTSNLRVSGHWPREDFSERAGVLMLGERLPTGKTRRNLTPETKAVLQNVFEYQVNEEKRGITGAWIDTGLNGQGFTFQFISKSSFVTFFYGFNDAGERIWLVGVHQGDFEFGNELSISMIEASGGQFSHFQPADIQESPWGELRIRFLDCNSAEATLSGLDGVQDMTLLPLVLADGLDCY